MIQSLHRCTNEIEKIVFVLLDRRWETNTSGVADTRDNAFLGKSDVMLLRRSFLESEAKNPKNRTNTVMEVYLLGYV